MKEFYVPNTRWQLEEWWHGEFPGVSAKDKTLKQLYAVYYKVMRGECHGCKGRG